MEKLFEDLKNLKLPKGFKLNYRFEQESTLMLPHLQPKEKQFLEEDIKHYIDRGQHILMNSLAGGIFFVKVPERVEKVQVEVRTVSSDFKVSIIFESAIRKAENIKHRPEAGKVVSTTWASQWIFPHFFEYQTIIQQALLIVIGKLIKGICDDSASFAYMKFENAFDIQLIIDNSLFTKLEVELLEKPN